ncbi:hypothetical protein ACUN9V_18785 [Salinicola sp. V024]|uniref:hypothetical protein n=1 Tax=Salinicola sp. V024 TaxID=3459609 RepID=UPI0040448748
MNSREEQIRRAQAKTHHTFSAAAAIESRPTREGSPAADAMPDGVRLTLLAVVTDRMISLRSAPDTNDKTRQLGRLIPAANWLIDDDKDKES